MAQPVIVLGWIPGDMSGARETSEYFPQEGCAGWLRLDWTETGHFTLSASEPLPDHPLPPADAGPLIG